MQLINSSKGRSFEINIPHAHIINFAFYLFQLFFPLVLALKLVPQSLVLFYDNLLALFHLEGHIQDLLFFNFFIASHLFLVQHCSED